MVNEGARLTINESSMRGVWSYNYMFWSELTRELGYSVKEVLDLFIHKFRTRGVWRNGYRMA